MLMVRRTLTVLTVSLITFGCALSFSLFANTRAFAAPLKATTTTVGSSGSPSAPGAIVTFTATVLRNGNGTADPTSGAVTFFDDAIVLGTGAVNGAHEATFSTSSLAIGNHAITAAFEGDATFAPSTSSVFTQVVGLTATTTSIASSLNPSQFEQSVTFTATVSSTSGIPSGTVAFVNGANPIPGCEAAPLIADLATCSTMILPIGSHSITAVYSGDSEYSASNSSSLDQVVDQLTTAVALSTNAPSSTFGDLVTFTAVVSAPAGTAPTNGLVTFYDGFEFIGSSTLDASAVATISIDALGAGNHSITATFEGTVSYAGSTSAVLEQSVDRAGTTTSLSFSANPTVFGEIVTFTATVVPDPGSGTVQFSIDGVDFGVPVAISAGEGTSDPIWTLAVGDHDVEATFSGNANYLGGTSTLTQSVGKAATSTMIDADVNPSVYGDSVTFTASVVPDPGSGTVQFLMDGTSMPGCGSELLIGGIATCTIGALEAGTHAITAKFNGSDSYLESTAATLDHVVNLATTSTAIEADINPAVYGSLVTLMATVTGVAEGEVPTGTVQFSVNGVTVGGPVVVAAGGASLLVPALTVGDHVVEATFSGNANYYGSTGALTQTVDRAAPTIDLTITPPSPALGKSVKFVATVTGSPNGTTPTGTVQFSVDGTAAGNAVALVAGTATVSNPGPTASKHSVKAEFSGDSNYLENLATSSFTVAVPPTVPPVQKSGYWMVGIDGAVFAFGDVAHRGNARVGDVASIEPTSSGEGYWIVTHGGLVNNFGDAEHFGDARDKLSTFERVVSLSSTPANDGYWLFTDQGRVIPFGAAKFLGDMSAIRLNGPVLGSVATPSGNGYYMVASDGGVFTFGDAVFHGSMGSSRLNAPVMGLVPDSDGAGYWLVARDGGVFSFGASFQGSMGGAPLNRPVIGMVGYGDGYLMVAEDGGIFNFSDEPFRGSLGSNPHSAPIVAVAAHAEP